MTDDTALPGEFAGASLFEDLPASTAPASPYRVLARKYRPKNFEELIGQDVMVRILANSFAAGRIHQAYLLTGVRGVGKTTTARILARALNYEKPARHGQPAITQPTIAMPDHGVHCEAIIESRHVDVIEMDAASHTGVDDVREIIEAARYKPASARMKVYIVDEVHMLSKQAFNALLKTLEEPPEHVKFVFATTEIEKVPITVRSRCLRFDLRRVEPDVLVGHLAKICAAEDVTLDEEALALIARAAEGSVRDSLSLLDQAIAGGGSGGGATADHVRLMLGLADKSRIIDLFEAVMSGRIAAALDGLSAQFDDGADPAQILLELAEFTHLVMRLKMMPDAPARAATREERERALQFSARLSLPVIDRAWQVLGKGLEEVRQSPRALAAADMVLVRLAHLADLPTPDEALRRLGQAGVPGPTLDQRAPAPALASASLPVASAAPARASGGAQRQPALAQPRPMPEPAATQPAAQIAPKAQFATFADVVARAASERDVQLKIALESHVRLVRFEDGTLEFSLAPGGSPDLAQTLMRKLGDWTGRRWIVALSRAQGQPSLREQADAQRREREHGVAQHPLVRSVLERFPGAAIVAVREGAAMAEPVAAATNVSADAHPDAGDDILYDDAASVDDADIDF